jgi:DNA (cytosine-5)-methyltransferase 1
LANAVLTPNGGRGGIGVGAVLAHGFNARQDIDNWPERTGPVDTDAYTQAVAIQSVNTPREKKQNGLGVSGDGVMYSLTCRDQHAIALDLRNALRDPDKRDAVNRQGCGIGDDVAHTLSAGAEHGVSYGTIVRRLTPRECERLQGFPDDYTLIPYRGKPAADGPRYKALGNSMAVPVMHWIGERIAMVEALPIERSEAA